MQSGLSAILRHKKEVQKLEPHRHFPHLTPWSFHTDRLGGGKLNGLTLQLLPVKVVSRPQPVTRPDRAWKFRSKIGSCDVEVKCPSCFSGAACLFSRSHRIRLRSGARTARAFMARRQRARSGRQFFCNLTLKPLIGNVSVYISGFSILTITKPKTWSLGDASSSCLNISLCLKQLT